MSEPTPQPAAPSAAPAPIQLPAVVGPTNAARRAWAGFDPETRRPTLIVAAIIAAMYLGSLVAADLVGTGSEPNQQLGTPIAISAELTIRPAPGWKELDAKGAGIRLSNGTVVLDLTPAAGTATATVLVSDEIDRIRTSSGNFTAEDPVPLTDPPGAARTTYTGVFGQSGATYDGEVTGMHIGAAGLVADAWAKQGSLDPYLASVHRMLASVAAAS